MDDEFDNVDFAVALAAYAIIRAGRGGCAPGSRAP